MKAWRAAARNCAEVGARCFLRGKLPHPSNNLLCLQQVRASGR